MSLERRIGATVDMPKLPQLTITLTPELEAFIQERVASERFATASEAVLTELRHEIEIGVEQTKAGQLSDGRAFFEELSQKLRPAS